MYKANRLNRQTKGFTLVEILIVVVILGILAAIVIPQFTSASETAKASSLQSQLQTIRSQLELYQVQHNGNYPTTAQMFGNLTGTTNVEGAAGNDFGPYLQKAPVNPFVGSSSVAKAASGAWQYDESTGAIKAVLPVSAFETDGKLKGDYSTLDADDVVKKTGS